MQLFYQLYISDSCRIRKIRYNLFMPDKNIEILSVKTADFEMPYAKIGNGPKTFVIIPGLNVKNLMPAAPAVATQYSRFLDDYTIYLFERVTNPPENYGISDMTRDAATAFDTLKIRDAYIMGTSLGGTTALKLCAERGDFVKKLIVCGAASKTSEKAQKIFEEWIKFADGENKNVNALNLSFAKNVYSPAFYKKFEKQIISSMEGATDDELKRFVIFARTLLHLDIVSELKNISVPVLAAGSEGDAVFGGNATLEIQKAIGKNCKTFLFEEYGHAFYDETPEFLDLLWSFFESGE